MRLFKKTTLEELKRKRTKVGMELKELTTRQRVKGDIKRIKSLKLKASLEGLPRIPKGTGVAFSRFRDFATKVSKTRLVKGGGIDGVLKGKRKKRNDFLF